MKCASRRTPVFDERVSLKSPAPSLDCLCYAAARKTKLTVSLLNDSLINLSSRPFAPVADARLQTLSRLYMGSAQFPSGFIIFFRIGKLRTIIFFINPLVLYTCAFSSAKFDFSDSALFFYIPPHCAALLSLVRSAFPSDASEGEQLLPCRQGCEVCCQARRAKR